MRQLDGGPTAAVVLNDADGAGLFRHEPVHQPDGIRPDPLGGQVHTRRRARKGRRRAANRKRESVLSTRAFVSERDTFEMSPASIGSGFAQTFLCGASEVIPSLARGRSHRHDPYHALQTATDRNPRQRFSLVLAASAPTRFATDCHGLQPRGSIKAPYFVATLGDTAHLWGECSSRAVQPEPSGFIRPSGRSSPG